MEPLLQLTVKPDTSLVSVVGGDKITYDVITSASFSETQLTLSLYCLEVTVYNTLDQIKCPTHSLPH